MIEPLFAGFVLALCVVALARLALGERRRARLDAAAQQLWLRLSRRRRAAARAAPGRAASSPASSAARTGLAGKVRPAPPAGPLPAGAPRKAQPAATGGGLLGYWRRLRERAARREAEKRAAREAEALIRRVRDGHWEGNVYRPKAFEARPARRSEAPGGSGPSDTLH